MEVENIILDELREFRKSQTAVNVIVIRNEERIKKIIEAKEDKEKRAWRLPIVISCIVTILTGINIAMKIWK